MRMGLHDGRFMRRRGHCIFLLPRHMKLCFKIAYMPLYRTQHLHFDLAIGSAVLFPSLEWNMGTNPYCSDHCQTTLTCIGKGTNSPLSHKKFSEAGSNWNTFAETSKLHYTSMKHLCVAPMCGTYAWLRLPNSLQRRSSMEQRLGHERPKTRLGVSFVVTIWWSHTFKWAKALGKRGNQEAKGKKLIHRQKSRNTVAQRTTDSACP